MLTVTDIFERLGTPAALARNIGVPLTTVLGWRDANFVPEWRQPALLKLAKALKVSLAPSDFPPIEARISRKKSADEVRAA